VNREMESESLERPKIPEGYGIHYAAIVRKDFERHVPRPESPSDFLFQKRDELGVSQIVHVQRYRYFPG
jgi:hypothetical protein